MSEPVHALDLSHEEWIDVSTNRWAFEISGGPAMPVDLRQKVFNVHEMTNLSKELRDKLVYDLMILPSHPRHGGNLERRHQEIPLAALRRGENRIGASHPREPYHGLYFKPGGVPAELLLLRHRTVRLPP